MDCVIGLLCPRIRQVAIKLSGLKVDNQYAVQGWKEG